MKMKYLLIPIIIIIASCETPNESDGDGSSKTGTISISGKVTDIQTGSSINGIRVYVQQRTGGYDDTNTDTFGKYSINFKFKTNVDIGYITVVIGGGGYIEKESRIDNPINGQSYTINASLQKK